MNTFETFDCSGQIFPNSLCQFWNDKSIPLQIYYLSSVSWKIIQTVYTLLNRSPLKWKLLRLLSARVKFCQFFMQFWNNEPIPLQILYPSSVSWKITPPYFFSPNNIYFANKERIKVKIFETFEHSSQNFQISYANF